MNPWFQIPAMMFDFAVLITDGILHAWSFYHEASAEVLELIHGATPKPEPWRP
jgi:hypothetical protein